MELGVSHVQSLSSLTPIVDNIFDKYNKNLVPIRSLSDHDTHFTDLIIPWSSGCILDVVLGGRNCIFILEYSLMMWEGALSIKRRI